MDEVLYLMDSVWTMLGAILVIFMIADFLIGTVAALKTGQWASDVGAKGIGRKVITWVIVVIGHGLDISLSIHMVSLRDIIVCAFLVNEAGSIIENIGRIDPHAIPEPVRKMIASLKAKTEKDLNKIEELSK